MDWEIALEHVGGDRELLAELVTVFLQDYPRLKSEAQQAIAQGDHSRLERAAHTLKGRLAFFGIHKVRDQAAALELMGRTNDVSRATQAWAEIESEMIRVLIELHSLSREQTA